MTGNNKKMNYPEHIGIKVSTKTKEWLKDDYSRKIREILEWCEESFPDIDYLFEVMHK